MAMRWVGRLYGSWMLEAGSGWFTLERLEKNFFISLRGFSGPTFHFPEYVLLTTAESHMRRTWLKLMVISVKSIDLIDVNWSICLVFLYAPRSWYIPSPSCQPTCECKACASEREEFFSCQDKMRLMTTMQPSASYRCPVQSSPVQGQVNNAFLWSTHPNTLLETKTQTSTWMWLCTLSTVRNVCVCMYSTNCLTYNTIGRYLGIVLSPYDNNDVFNWVSRPSFCLLLIS